MRKLIIVDDEGRRTTVPLVRSEVTIGRLEGNTIRLTERNVSRKHARIYRENGAYLVEDTSRYGTKRNGQRIEGIEPFVEGDVVVIGTYRVEMVAEEAAAVAEPAADDVPTTRLDATELSAATAAAPREPTPDARPAPRPRGRLVCMSEPFVGSEFAFTADRMTIGTAGDCDLIIGHPSIAAHHAAFERTDDGYTIAPIDAGYPVALNGAYNPTEPLRAGDELVLGELRFRFALPGQDVGLVAIDEIPDDAIPGGRPAWFVPAIAVGAIVLVLLLVLMIGGGGEDTTPAPAPEGTAATEPATSYAAALDRGRAHMTEGRWAEALTEFEAVPRDAEEFDMASSLAGRARNEQTNQTNYETARRAFDEGDYELTLQSLAAIPAGTYYRTRATDENLERRAVQSVVDGRIAASQVAEDEGDLDEALRVVQEVAPLAPDNTALNARITQLRALSGDDSAVAARTNPTPPTPTPTPEPTREPEEARADREEADRDAEREREQREEREAEERREREEREAREAEERARAEEPSEPEEDSSAGRDLDDDRDARREASRELRQQAARAGVQQNFQDAIRLLEEARELNPGDPQINLMLFSNYRQVGNRSRAARAIRRYLRQRPDDPRRAEYEQWLEENAP